LPFIKTNRVKQAMREGRTAYGYNLTFPSPWMIEILGMLDFDFVWLDGEHGPFSLADIEATCRVAELVGITPIARVPSIQPHVVLSFLDRGVMGIMGPHIGTREQAEQLVKACYFGPLGERSFGGNRGTRYTFTPDAWGDKREFYREANDNMLVGALLEDQAAVDNIDEILKVEGLDYFGIGPNDFSQGIGFPGEPENPRVVKAMKDLTDRIRRGGGRMGGDFMKSIWVHDMLLGSGREFLKDRRKLAKVKRTVAVARRQAATGRHPGRQS
jgi:4-hydroxy-2-oxoheptanedioate aldolase